MIRTVVVLATGVLPVAASDVRGFTRAANAIQILLNDGRAEVIWLSPSSARVRQMWQDPAPLDPTQPSETVDFAVADNENTIRLVARELAIEISKRPLLISFMTTAGEPLLRQKAPVVRGREQLHLEFGLTLQERLYGLGVETGDLNLRGRSIESSRPLLLSSAGYGLFFPGKRRDRFDLGKEHADRLRIATRGAEGADYCFYFGAGLKETLEQHHQIWPKEIELRRGDVAFPAPLEKPTYAHSLEGRWESIVSRVLHGSLSGINVPAINATWLSDMHGLLRMRAETLAALMPIVLVPEGFALSDHAQRLRRSLEPHLITYLAEARDRGLPVIHPLAMQFPGDSEAAGIVDQFLLGDELLAAPIAGEESSRELYLPQGIWTELRTNRAIRGKKRIRVTGYADEIPLFVRNGSILPLQRDGRIELHYFPKLGAEYFLWEPEAQETTQVHAAPAVDELRLEIEERVGRTYEWIIHNVSRPVRAEFGSIRYAEAATRQGLNPGCWLYDQTRKNLHIQVRLKPGDDWILNTRFSEEEWWIADRDTLRLKEAR